MDDTQKLQTPSQLTYHYRYEKLLGEGANGKTYLARNLNTGEAVAIKALKRFQRNDFKNYDLFKREAETLSSIHVHGVPRFFESIFSEDPTGENFIIQEFVSAPSLQSYLDKKRKFTERETLYMMAKIATILSSLHSYVPPVIHRDIKPANILCTLPDEGMSWEQIDPFLIDFGAVANAHSSDRSTIAGTVGYMAPEQNLGECLPQSDFYALGATALHMLTCKAPYNMEFETYTIKIDKEIAANAPLTSQNMKALLAILLDYNFDKRPKNAKDLLQMINNVQNNRAPEANIEKQNKPPSRLQRFGTFMQHLIFGENNLSPTVDYIETNGYIQTMAYGFVQFTFDANGMSWLGRAKLPFSQKKPNATTPRDTYTFRTVKPHTPCVVSYHPQNPAVCKLVSIELPFTPKSESKNNNDKPHPVSF